MWGVTGRNRCPIPSCAPLDPHHVQEGSATIPAHLGLAPAFTVTDQLSGERFDWRIGPNYVRLDPWTRQAHVLRVEGG